MTRWAALAACLLIVLAPARALAATGELSDRPAASFADFAQAHPRYAVLPAPYFEPGLRPESYLDVAIRARSFMSAATPWFAEIDTGAVRRVPARGAWTQEGWSGFCALGEAVPERAEIRLFSLEEGEPRLVTRVALPRLAPTRFSATYARGPFARQAAREWGEDGISLVLLQLRERADFGRQGEPVLYVGGDYNYQRVEGTVRYLRSHGVNAFGYRPDYDRDAREDLLDMARADLPDVRDMLERAAPGGRVHLVGLCLGGLLARGIAHVDARAPRPIVASVTGIGVPHEGSALADLQNACAMALPWAPIHRYKDAREAMVDFNRQVPAPAGVPHYSVVLDPKDHVLDWRYRASDWPLRLLHAFEGGRDPRTIATDGLILVEGQAFGEHLSTWVCDHAGMINLGLASTYFDAYRAHLELMEAVARRANKCNGNTP